MEQPQVAPSIKQKTPTMLDAAATATNEMESYSPAQATVAECLPEDEPSLKKLKKGIEKLETACLKAKAGVKELWALRSKKV